MNMFKPVAATNVKEYIESISEPRRSEVVILDKLIQKTVPKLKPYFAYNMIGYGSFHYKSKSGREGDWPIISLASQKNYISLYVCAIKDGKYLAEQNKDKFPKASTGKSCIRFKKLDDINLEALGKIIKKASQNPGF